MYEGMNDHYMSKHWIPNFNPYLLHQLRRMRCARRVSRPPSYTVAK
jgi:hypothetical protein